MPAYQATPFKPSPALLIPGTPQYVFGSFNSRTGPTLGTILTDSAVTTTATVVFQIRSGNAPVAGSLITVRGASNSVNFNVTNAVVLTVVTNMDTGVCTVTYAITSTTQGVVADAGEVEIPQPEIGEVVASAASVPVAVSFTTANPDQGKVITAVVSSPLLAVDAAFTVTLQGANFDIASEYQDIATVATVTAGSYGATGHFNSGQGDAGTPAAPNQLNYRFYRLNVSGVSGGASTIVGKIED